jgi:hypothetical protein
MFLSHFSNYYFLNLRSYLMDWYFGSGIDELVVPKYQELSDRLPSPDSWSKWGISESESFRSSNKRFFMDANLAQQQLNHNGKRTHNEVEYDAFHDKEHSCGSSICEGFSEESFHQRAVSRDRPDCQLNDLAGFEQMNDIFLYKRNFWDYLDLFHLEIDVISHLI